MVDTSQPTPNPLIVMADHIKLDHTGAEASTVHIHVTSEQVATFELTPSHQPRVNTPEYERSRKYLLVTQNKGCVVCGVRLTTLSDPVVNIFKATNLETHHYPIERSLMNACDPNKVHAAFPEVIDTATLELFVDSPRNLIVLCDIHHRSLEQGIHHLLVQDYAVLPFLYANYQIVANAQNRDAYLAIDEKGEQDRAIQEGTL